MDNELLVCSKCNLEKNINEFNIRNKKTGTRRKECKSCRKEYNKKYRLDNLELHKQKDKEYHNKNKEHRNQKAREYRENNYEKCIQAEKNYYINNRTEILKRKKIYHQLNKNNPQYKIKRNLRIRMWSVLHRGIKTGSAVDDLGCSVEFLLDWFEFIFHNYELNGTEVNWDNAGEFWDIDHVIPLSKIDLTERSNLLIAAHWTNLVPLPKTNNRSKYNKICISSIKKQKYLLEKFMIFKNTFTPLKFLEYFNDNSIPAGL